MPISLFLESGSSLLDFIAQGESYTLKRDQIMTAREIGDTERHANRKGGDERYNSVPRELVPLRHWLNIIKSSDIRESERR